MLSFLAAIAIFQAPKLQSDGLWGYISMSVTPPPAEYGYGVSLYSTAWPLLARPVANFQIGLCSTWILPDNRSVDFPLVPRGTVARDSMPERGPSFWTVFQTIEGGLGFWVSNRYPAPTAKFRMNGSVDGYNHEVSSPGWQFGGEPLPGDQMGIAQLSSHVLIPPDGVTLAKDTCGQLFGYAWMALPLVSPTQTPVPTGNQCWTAFFNTKNFRGPVAFYLPVAWTRMSRTYPPAVGRGLDVLPGLAGSGAIEINTVPQFVSDPIGGATYSRIPTLQFPADRNGRTVLMHKLTVYSKAALWNQVAAWAAGGKPAAGAFDARGAFLPAIKANPLHFTQGGKRQAVTGVDRWFSTQSLDDHTFGLQWKKSVLSPWKGDLWKAEFPNYFKRQGASVEAVSAGSTPETTGLQAAQFPEPDRTRSYLPSENGEGVWKHPGPAAGPFQAKLADGSVVTYCWYRFIDQPSLQDAGLSEADKARLQSLAEKIQRNWTMDKPYMAPPDRGELAALDPALIVHPPKGLEFGYVPIAIRQDPGK
ncbi:MAG TPA: hypothetical protein VHE55_02595 [Fimbriimonadaceae bacterium]|nr:hypothetical protein [Fimbriimonadaceae bacterium]